MVKIKISVDFSRTPGPRLIKEGSWSGELFRDQILAPKVMKAIETKDTLEVDLDGTAGYGTSFLEESFGGLIRKLKIPYDNVKDILRIVSDEEPSYIDEIWGYINDANEKGQK